MRRQTNGGYTFDAKCPYGWVATGGGYDDPHHRLTVLGSKPDPHPDGGPPDSWEIRAQLDLIWARHAPSQKNAARSVPSGNSFKVYVVCAPGLKNHDHGGPGGVPAPAPMAASGAGA
jgi:hypothetical protein